MFRLIVIQDRRRSRVLPGESVQCLARPVDRGVVNEDYSPLAGRGTRERHIDPSIHQTQVTVRATTRNQNDDVRYPRIHARVKLCPPSVGALGWPHQLPCGLNRYLQIQPDRPARDVVDIELDAVFEQLRIRDLATQSVALG